MSDDIVVSTLADPEEVGHRTKISSPEEEENGVLPDINLSSIVNSSLETKPRGFFADQFENESNFQAHYHGTGPEILRQTSGHIDAFVSGAGEAHEISRYDYRTEIG